MCVEVYNLDSKTIAGNVVELAELLKVPVEDMRKFPASGYESGITVNSCLCQIDIFKACENAGFDAKYDRDFNIEVTKKEAKKYECSNLLQ